MQDRINWGNAIEFILSSIGYSVGLGNIYRFPYICMENGGGAFLIPYFIFLFVCGSPLFLAETTLGQFASISVLGAFEFSPVFRGVGWGMLILSGFCCTYYNILMAWVVYYFGMSFQWVLPWSSCNNTWNTDTCYSFYDMMKNNMTFESYVQTKNIVLINDGNDSIRWRSSAEEFYLYKALNISESINDLDSFNIPILISFIVSWVVVYLCILKGVKSVGKVVYISATMPYILLTVLVIQGAILPGSWLGIKYYIIPDFKALLTVKIWVTAATQIFYSLGPAWGGLIMISSFNKFNHNVFRTAIIIPIICCLTSFYGGFAIFAIMGHMGHITNITDISQIIKSGPGLAFVAYPQAMSLLPGSAILSVIFFFTLFTLGLDTLFGTVETLTQGLMDQFPKLRGKYRAIFILFVVIVMNIFGLPFTTRGGAYLFQIVDWYSTPIAVLVVAICETISIAYFYNFRKLINHIEMMIRKKLPKFCIVWFSCCLLVFTPLSLIIIFINVLIKFDEPKFNNNQPYPRWAIYFGWCLGMSATLPIPLYAAYELIVRRKNMKQAFLPNKKFSEIELYRSSAPNN